jgi:hypothetical protein
MLFSLGAEDLAIMSQHAEKPNDVWKTFSKMAEVGLAAAERGEAPMTAELGEVSGVRVV